IPHIEKHNSKTPDRVARQHDRRILPVPEPFFSINILISTVYPPCKSDLSVDHTNLSVIPIILYGGQDRADRVKHLTLNSSASEIFRIIIRQHADTAHAVIHKSYFNPLGHLVFKYAPYFVPH